MARIAGVDLPRNKRIEVALTRIYGIGFSSSRKILNTTGVDPSITVKDLTEEQVSRLRREIERNFKVEGSLRQEYSMSIKRLMEIGCYRGFRHRRSLPVRGQRTRTNARTRKGHKRKLGDRKRKR